MSAREDRIACQVPFCRRTAARDRFPGDSEIICAKHWRFVSEKTKAEYRKLRRLARLGAARGKAMPALWNRLAVNWCRAKAEAIEAVGGIG